jgi:tripartite-type tricarboxylate transporter receptor subunit TctC
MLRSIVTAACLAGAFALAQPAAAQDYPSRPIRFVVPFTAGSATDTLARVLGQKLNAANGWTVVVENVAGASGMMAAQTVARAAPDGLSVLVTSNTTHASNQNLFKKLSYDPVKDFEPIGRLGNITLALAVHPSVPANSVQELIAYGKANPGKLTFGSGSTSARVAGEMLKTLGGFDMLHVPYKSNPLAINDLLGGQIQMMITDTATGLPQVNAGKLRALGVSGKQRSPLAPDVPTIDEAGVKGYEMSYWFAAYLPAKTPSPVVAKLHGLIIKAMNGPAMKSFYASTGTDPFQNSSEELAKFQAAETAKWGKIIKAAGIQPE